MPLDWIRKMWYIYTVDYYTEEKNNNDILKFTGKWMEQVNIILSEVIQTQKYKYYMYSLIIVFRHKAKKPVYKLVSENLDNNEDPKKDIHRSNLHGK